MPQPVTYTRNYDFTSFQEQFPNQPLPAAPIDVNLDNAGISIGQIVGRLALIQRDDGDLANQSVTIDALSNDVRALLGSPINPRGAWVTATAYAALDLVTVNGITYICAVAHTSGTFATDLAAFKWVLFSNPVGATGTSFFQKFSGDGATTAFTLSSDLGTDEKVVMVFYDDGGDAGYQVMQPTAFTISGTTLTISPAPALGTDNIYIFAPSSLLGAITAAQAACAASEAAAATSETNAGNSETAAAASASTASTQATNASNSATAAAASNLLLTNSQSVDYTLVLGDANKIIRLTGAVDKTFTVPPNSSVAYPTGTQIVFQQDGSGVLTLAAGVGVTIKSENSWLKLAAQYAMASITKVDTNEWLLSGSLKP